MCYTPLITDLPPIWVLNLERSNERREFMETQLNKLNLEYEIIQAVDGLKLTDYELGLYSKKEALRCSERELSLGEIGCILSHVRMWQRLITENYDDVMILEDDVLINEMLLHALRNRDKFPDDWEYINFKTDVGQIPFGEPVWGIHRMCRFSYYPNRTSAYLINRKGAEKLLKYVFPIRWPADNFTGGTYITGMVCYGIDPQIVALQDYDSEIWKNDEYFALKRSLRGKSRILFRKFINCLEYLFNKCNRLQR